MRQLAVKIPQDKIIEIIEKNVIANAVPIASNAYMKFLFVIWYNYIEPNGDGDLGCPFCLNSVLNNFRGMQDGLVELYTENKKLNAL